MVNTAVDEETPLLSESRGKAVKRTPLPKLQIVNILLVCFCELSAGSSISPYINQLIAELDVTGGDKRKVGYYAGLIESLLFATEALTVLQWGRLSDRIGRKPVLLTGLVVNALSMLCFGLSRTFWMLVISRCLCGLLNGNIGIVKGVIGELTDSTNRADAFAYIPIVGAVSATIAPVVGGSLAHPQERFPTVFTSCFWKKFPYFLPCFVVAVFIFLCTVITSVLFNETPRNHCKTNTSQSFSGTSTSDGNPFPLCKLLTYPVVLSVCNYFCFSFMEIAFASLLPLLMTMPVELGGLGCSPAIIGYVLGTLGAYGGIFQIVLFSKLVRRFGEKTLIILGILVISMYTILFPVISSITRRNGVTWVTWCFLTFTLSLHPVSNMSYCCIFVYINASSPSRSSLGATNGVAQTMVSVARAIGPGLATSLFSLSLQKNLLGGYAVYAVLFLFSCISLFFAVRLPSQVWVENR